MTRTNLLMLALGVVAGAVQAQAPKQAPAPKPPPAQAAAPAPTQDRADIDRTQIIGNRELPKVLYIVPWKKPLPGDLAGRPGGGVLDEALAPVDRDVFRRQVQYDAQLQAPKAGATPAAAPTRP
ncbi:hypothetical protein [Variovorax sp. YR752]|uniref:hypothetical protein n=1 Tax=Variovorax sp. YR752 TaxID=1884383 RepID=UPI003137F4A5